MACLEIPRRNWISVGLAQTALQLFYFIDTYIVVLCISLKIPNCEFCLQNKIQRGGETFSN